MGEKIVQANPLEQFTLLGKNFSQSDEVFFWGDVVAQGMLWLWGCGGSVG
jgi:hypothetical protein